MTFSNRPHKSLWIKPSQLGSRDDVPVFSTGHDKARVTLVPTPIFDGDEHNALSIPDVFFLSRVFEFIAYVL